MPGSVLISVVTPTYNRLHTLPRLAESLMAQRHSPLEWVVVDDGSTDETPAYLDQLSRRGALTIRLLRQANAGRAAAINAGVKAARGEYIVISDSDDWFTDHALETLLDTWHTIPPDQQEHFAAVVGLCADEKGTIIGSSFPQSPIDSDFINIRTRLGVRGDKKEMFRADVLKDHPFPVSPGERRVASSLVHNRIARRYRARFVNAVVTGKEYLPEGLSANIDRVRMLSPNSSRLRYLEFLNGSRGQPLAALIRNGANYTRYSLHGHISLARQAADIERKAVWALTYPLGALLFLRDRKRGARPQPRGSATS